VRRLRFCHVTTFYPPHSFGGDGIAVQRLADALARRGHEVTVVHAVEAFNSLHDGASPAVPDDDRVVRRGLDSRLGKLSPLLTHQLGRPVVHRRRLAQLLDDKFDVINFHNVSLVGGPGVLSYGTGVKVYTAHEHWLVCPTHVLWRYNREPCDDRQCLRCVLAHHRPPQIWRWTPMLERSVRHVDAFIALSEFSRRKHSEYGFRREMEVLPCFAPDPEREAEVAPAVLPSRPYVLYSGRLERLKGLDDVIPLFERDLGVDLLIAGTGTHERELKAAASGVDSVRFLGWLDQGALRWYYRHALAVIVPTVGYETFGQAVIEAFSNGVPVIARRQGPLPELVDDTGGGETFTTGGELQDILRRLLADPNLRIRYGTRGRAAFESQFCEDAVVPRYLDIVRRAAERSGDRAVAAALEPPAGARGAPP
jgi:glycosyltransferase involved in cell wall biosynthesis